MNSEFLKKILENKETEEDNMFTDHLVDEYTIKNVPCREIEGIGIIYSSKTMSRILKLLPIMKKTIF